MNEIPNTIYLQIRDEDGKVLDSRIDEVVAWCSEQINANDEPYIRLYQLRAAIEEIYSEINNQSTAAGAGMYRAINILDKHGLLREEK